MPRYALKWIGMYACREIIWWMHESEE
jgi:hypothetical protein